MRAPHRKNTPVFQRKRYSAQDVDRALTQWSEKRKKRRAERSPEDKKARRQTTLGICCGLVILSCAVTTGIVTEHGRSTAIDNMEEIQRLRHDLDTVDSSDYGPDFTAHLTELYRKAETDSHTVIDHQHEFMKLAHAANHEEGNGGPTPSMKKAVDVRKRIAPLFDPSTYVLPDNEIKAWSTAPSLNPGERIDPRMEWFIWFAPDNSAMDSTRYAWEIASISPVVDRASGVVDDAKVNVVLVNRDTRTHAVLAWAHATYEKNTSGYAFTSLNVTVSDVA